MQNNNDNILSRLLKSTSGIIPFLLPMPKYDQLSLKNAKKRANNLPYFIPSLPVATFGSQSNPLGFAKNTSPLPDVSSSLRPAGIKPDVPSSVPSLPVATFGSQPNSLDMEPLPNAIETFETSDLASLKPKQSQLPEPISPVEPQQVAQPQQNTFPQQDTGSQQSFWDYLRSPEFLQRLSDYGIGYALSDGTIAQSLASGAMNLRRGDMEREKRGQVNQTVEYLKSKGYSEEEARFMAGNKDALNAFLAQTINGGNRNPQFTNDGRMLVEDPNAPGGYRYVTVEGGKAHEDMQKREQLKKLQIVDAKIMRESTSHAINSALEILKENPKSSTGPIGQFLQNLWNTPAARLRDHLETIRGGAMLHRLERIKALSPNGASGLGNLTDKEGVRLENVYVALQQSLSPQELIRNLQRLQEIYNKATDAQLAILMNDNITAADVDEAFGSGSQLSQGNLINIPKMSLEEASIKDNVPYFRDSSSGKFLVED
ncbi:hypothetical protein [Bartonella rattimassiliensis]|uniref:Uncharacterized protein n=1 Tax=Bartonella rattimassiliensis 15908 TaxID=1094556 RepID=J1JKU4_9HYPH|nr:hypothetical protein [Bartonella rattimassiliensis]EJF85302.1 hypothetical protein MCY_01143 [Bartonella rattimassiliensis 15908]